MKTAHEIFNLISEHDSEKFIDIGAFIIFDENYEILYVSKLFEDSMDLDAVRLKGKNLQEVISFPGSPSLDEIISSAFTESTNTNICHIRLLNTNPEIKAGILPVKLRRGEKAAILHLIDFIPSRLEYKTFVENIPGGAIFLIGEDRKFKMAAGAALKVLKLSPEGFTGKTAISIFGKETGENIHNAIKSVFENGKKYFEYTYKSRVYGNNAKVIENRNGKSREVILFSMDVTGFREIERNLKERNDFIQTIMDNLPIGIALHRISDGGTLYMNEKFQEIYGWSIEEINNTDEFFEKVYPNEPYRNRIKKKVFSDINSGDPSRMHWENIQVTRKNGEKRYINAVNIPYAEQDTMISTVWDITEMKRIQNELVFAKEKAEQSDLLKSAFISNMSHEIRTPMNGILGFSEVLRDPGLSVKKRKKYTDIIIRSGHRLMQIINDVLEISKIESGHVNLKYTSINLKKFLTELIDFYKPAADKQGLYLKYEIKDKTGNPILVSDETKLRQIMDNLISNALKFTEKGGISIGFVRKEMNWEIYVQDTGIGIDKKFKEYIFDRFSQVSGNKGGTGLGLSIVKKLTDILGHGIKLDSEPGFGSKFYFHLPLNRNTDNFENQFNLNEMTKEIENPAEKVILVAEDDEVNYLLIEEVLSKFSFTILRASTGKEAIKMCRENNNINLVFMDIKMPEMDGLEATRKIREFNKKIPIIAQTAYAMVNDRQNALDAGCDDYIAKPIKLEDIEMFVRKYVS